jgi:hypothetical protein
LVDYRCRIVRGRDLAAQPATILILRRRHGTGLQTYAMNDVRSRRPRKAR